MKGRIAFVLVVMVVGAASFGGVAVPQPAVSPEKETKKPAPVPLKSRTLTVNVFLVDPSARLKRLPAVKALVHVQGDDDPYFTDAKGQVKVPGIVADRVTLEIKVIGADLCQLPSVPLTGGDQVLSVLIDKSHGEACKRLD